MTLVNLTKKRGYGLLSLNFHYFSAKINLTDKQLPKNVTL